MEKFKTMIMEGRSDANGSNILDRIDDSMETESESYLSIAAKLVMIGLIWFIGMKIP